MFQQLYLGKKLQRKELEDILIKSAEKEGLNIKIIKNEDSSELNISDFGFKIANISIFYDQEEANTLLVEPKSSLISPFLKSSFNRLYLRTILEVHSETFLIKCLNTKEKKSFFEKYFNSIRENDSLKEYSNSLFEEVQHNPYINNFLTETYSD
jgi:hypothetical protein